MNSAADSETRSGPAEVLSHNQRYTRWIAPADPGSVQNTVIAGPLNYFGVNPKVTSCNVPKPS